MESRNKTDISKYNQPFPQRLRTLMTEKKVTQDTLAAVLKKKRQTVSQYMNGISEPGYDSLCKIADYFDVSADYLLGRTQDPKRSPSASDQLGLSQTNIDYLSSQALIGDRIFIESLISAVRNSKNARGYFAQFINSMAAHEKMVDSNRSLDELVADYMKYEKDLKQKGLAVLLPGYAANHFLDRCVSELGKELKVIVGCPDMEGDINGTD